MRIAANAVVTVEYTLKNAAGELLDASARGLPLAYLHGAEQIVPGLERALEGLVVGDDRNVVVSPEDGYGMPDPEGIFSVPRTVFPAEMELSPGDTLLGEDEDGGQIPVRVVELREGSVLVDANHPLAGQTLYYHVTVREVRPATAGELERGRVDDGGAEH